jgi:hypothetical protein
MLSSTSITHGCSAKRRRASDEQALDGVPVAVFGSGARLFEQLAGGQFGLAGDHQRIFGHGFPHRHRYGG